MNRKNDSDVPQVILRIKDLRMSRRTLLRGMAIGGAGLATAGFVACGDDDDDTSAAPDDRGGRRDDDDGRRRQRGARPRSRSVKFGYGFPAPHAGFCITYYNALEQGFWEEEGLEVEIDYQTAVMPLLAGGTVDYGEVSADELLNAYAAGQKLKAFYQPTTASSSASWCPRTARSPSGRPSRSRARPSASPSWPAARCRSAGGAGPASA